jgi:hypothetical protein
MLSLAGCWTSGVQPLVRVTGENDRLAGWLARARADGTTRQAVRAIGRLRIDGPGGRGSLRELIVVERPARLRLESLSPLNQTVTLLVSDGEEFAFFDGRTIERGASGRDLLERVGLELDPAEAIDVLLAAPALPDGPIGEVLAQGDDRLIEIDGRRIRFDAQGILRGVESRAPDGALLWSAEYDRWQPLPGGAFPFALALYFPGSELRAELELDDVELNPVLEGQLFRVQTEVD